MKHLWKVVSMILVSPLAAAGDDEFYQPRFEVQALASAARHDPGIRNANLPRASSDPNAKLSELHGTVGAVKLSMLVQDHYRLLAEGSFGSTERADAGRDLIYEVDQTHARAGARYQLAATNSSPVYIEAGLDYAYYRFEDQLRFGSSYTEAEVGENPASDSDTRANPKPLRGTRDESYGVGHVGGGYRDQNWHWYLDAGYGRSKSGDLVEFTGGISYTFARHWQLLGEYRTTRLFDDNDGRNEIDIRLTDYRFGAGYSF